MNSPGNITFINAGAGSGKTYRLTELLYESLFSGFAQPERVIATTFTRKAAAELRERARTKLMERKAWSLAQQIGAARIGTVNSVCGDLLQRFAFEAGVATELRVLDENQAEERFRQALDAVLDLPARNVLNDLSRRLGIQDKFTKALLWESRVQAVASQARANSIPPSALSVMAEDNANDLLSYFGKPVRKNLNAELVASLSATIPLLRNEQAKKEVKATTDYLELCEQSLKALGTDSLPWSDWVKLAEGSVGAKSRDHVAGLCLMAGQYLKHPGLHRDIRDFLKQVFSVAAQAMEVYAGQKRQMGMIDFIDQEQLLLGALELGAVSEVLAGELDLLLVDEFQDTSPIQLAIFLKLASLAKKTYWVGDPKQSIYGFRGSDPLLMHEVQKGVTAKEILKDSWRSTPSLVALNNAVFKQAFQGQYPSAEIVLNATRHEPAGQEPALEHWQLAGKNDGLRRNALSQALLKAFHAESLLVDKETGTLRRMHYSDIVILARSNDKITELADTLTQAGIPVSIEQPGLLATPEVVLALACLRRLSDPYDTLSTAEIVSLSTSESPEIWLADRLAWLRQDAVKQYLWKEAGENPLPILQQLAVMRPELSVLSPREAMQRVITLCNLPSVVVAWRPDAETAKRRLANLQQLLELAVQYEEECQSSARAATISGLLLWLGDLADNEQDVRAMPSVDAVQVMTYHKAKGLEWPVVICTGLTADIKSRLWDVSTISREGFDAACPLQGRFIRYWPWPFGAKEKVSGMGDIEQSEVAAKFMRLATEEAQRLLYVGMTRARDKLIMTLSEKETGSEGWLGALRCEAWFKPLGSVNKMVLPGFGDIPYRCELFQPEEVSAGVPTQTDPACWFNPAAGILSREPLKVSPSGKGPSDRYIVVEEIRLAARIPLAGSIQGEMDRLGTGLHACLAFAVSQKRLSLDADQIDRIMSGLGMKDWVDVALASAQLTAFLNWIQSRWQPIAVYAELPVQQSLTVPAGQVLRGQIDMLLETADGWILIDHKSNPGGAAGWEGLACKYGGQLQAYREAIEHVTDRPVLESWLYLPVSGGAIRIGEKSPSV